MYISIITTIFGILFLFSGVSGFVPGFVDSNGLLYGIFQVDLIHNIANFIIGFLAIICALRWKMDRLFLQVFGILFGLLTIAGYVFQGNLFITQVNTADNVLHLIVAVIFITLGFAMPKEGQV